MITVTLQYGLTKSITKDINSGTTIRNLIADPNVRAILGLPEAVQATIDGETVSFDTAPEDGDTVTFERQAAQKAACAKKKAGKKPVKK